MTRIITPERFLTSHNLYYPAAKHIVINTRHASSHNMATLPPNTSWITVSGSGTAECDGLYKPSTAPPTVSESGTASSIGYWNGKMAFDRADGNAKRNPSISYSGSYKAWRIARLDGHLAYTIVNDDDMPTTTEPWDVYKKGVAPPPLICIFATEQEARATWTGVGFEKRSPGETKTVVAAATSGGDNRILGQILALVPKLQQPELNQLQSILAGTANGGASTSKKPNVVFVLGGPGAGKMYHVHARVRTVGVVASFGRGFVASGTHVGRCQRRPHQ